MMDNQKFDKELNYDTATPEKISATNEELVEYMDMSGENVASEQIRYLMDNQKTETDKKPVKNPINDKLLAINTGILKTLEKIRQEAFDEQDTSIKRTSAIKSTIDFPDAEGFESGAKEKTSKGGMFGGLFGFPGLGGRRVDKTPPKTKPTKPKTKTPPKQAKVKTPPKPTKPNAPKPTKPTGILKKLTRFAKPIPILGTALVVGTALYSAQDGYKRADEILGVKKDELTTTDKLSAAAGSVVNDFTFGLVSSESTAKKIAEFTQDKAKDKIIKKYQDELGLIDHDYIGNSDIENWAEIKKLKPEEIQEIISLDDWSSDDLAELKASKESAEKMRSAEKTGSTEKISPTEKEVEILEDNLKSQDSTLIKYQQQYELALKSGDFKKAESLKVAIQAIENGKQITLTQIEKLKSESTINTSVEGKKATSSNVYTESVSTNSEMSHLAEPEIKIAETVPLKEAKEVQMQQTSQNLINQTKSYEIGKATAAAQIVVANSNINNTNVRTDKPVEQRLLNLYQN